MIPDYQSCMRPALAHLADGRLHRSREVKDALADHFGLSEAERAELLPSGRQRVIDNRVGWALTYLSQAGLVNRPARGQVQITPSGQDVLASHAARIDLKVLEQFPSYLEFRDRTREARPTSGDPSVEHTAARGVARRSPCDCGGGEQGGAGGGAAQAGAGSRPERL